jgi:hypothetical protein
MLTDSAAAHTDIPELPPELSQLPSEALRVYGPVIAQQCDHAGIPIQRYVTTLVECQSGEWLLRRLVSSLRRSSVGTEKVVEIKVAPADARRWLAENQIVLKGCE